MREVSLKDLTNYAIEDADITLQIWNKLKYILEEKNLGKVFFMKLKCHYYLFLLKWNTGESV